MAPEGALDNTPVIGVLMLKTTFPRIPGDVGHRETYPFPVSFCVVEGASPQRAVYAPDARLLKSFIRAARNLEAQGVGAIATSCGFMAVYQRQLADAVDIPVFSSALLQIPLARSVIRTDQAVGVLTADRRALTNDHFAGVGVDPAPAAVVGLESMHEFSSVFLDGKRTLDESRCRREMEKATLALMTAHPKVGAIVMECTNMPPYRDAVRKVSGLPVFDVVTLIQHAFGALQPRIENPFP